MERNIVVLGGGIGGVVAASRLSREVSSLGWGGRVVLLDRELAHPFAPSFPWVMTGARRPEQITLDLQRLRRRGIELVRGEVLQIDPECRVVRTAGGPIDYTRLVIALGAELAPEALSGFSEAAHNVYTLEGVAAAGRALRAFDGGRLAVVVSRLPYKCPAAPYEIALLADALLRERSVRDRVSIDVYTPEPYPMPTAGPAIGQALTDLLSERGISLHPQSSVESIEPASRELIFAGGARASYDLLFGVPPHRAPEAIRSSGLLAKAGSSPWTRTPLPRRRRMCSASGTSRRSPSPMGSSCRGPVCSPRPRRRWWPDASPGRSLGVRRARPSMDGAGASLRSEAAEPSRQGVTSTTWRVLGYGCIAPVGAGT